MEGFHGIPLTGPPGPGSGYGPPHTRYRYDARGNLKIQGWPFFPIVLDGQQRTLYIEVPENWRDHFSAADPGSAEFQDPLIGHEDLYEIGPGGVVTMKGRPDAKPSFIQVVWPVRPDRSDFRPGWTQDPNPGVPGLFQAGAVPGKWVQSLDADGDPVYGPPPASALPSGLTAAAEQFMADVYAAFGRFVASQK